MAKRGFYFFENAPLLALKIHSKFTKSAHMTLRKKNVLSNYLKVVGNEK